MKLASSALLAAAALLAPAIASAQPSQTPPPPPPPPSGGYGYYSTTPTRTPDGFQLRAGRLALGVGLGFGGMDGENTSISCPTCEYDPLSVGIDFHIGGMLSHRLALLFEIQGNAQTVEQHGFEGEKTLSQVALLGAAQFWLTPRIWLKGGLGVASLQNTYSDAYGDQDEQIDTGAAVLLGAGIELVQSQNFALDLQGRVLVGSYDLIDDSITAGTIGLGLNWY